MSVEIPPPIPAPLVANPVARPRRRLNQCEGIAKASGMASPLLKPSPTPCVMNRPGKECSQKAAVTRLSTVPIAPTAITR